MRITNRFACLTGLCSRSLSPNDNMAIDSLLDVLVEWLKVGECRREEMVEFHPRVVRRNPNRWRRLPSRELKLPDFHHLRHQTNHLHDCSESATTRFDTVAVFLPRRSSRRRCLRGRIRAYITTAFRWLDEVSYVFLRPGSKSTQPEPDGRHCERYEDSPGMRGQFISQLFTFLHRDLLLFRAL